MHGGGRGFESRHLHLSVPSDPLREGSGYLEDLTSYLGMGAAEGRTSEAAVAGEPAGWGESQLRTLPIE